MQTSHARAMNTGFSAFFGSLPVQAICFTAAPVRAHHCHLVAILADLIIDRHPNFLWWRQKVFLFPSF